MLIHFVGKKEPDTKANPQIGSGYPLPVMSDRC